MDATSSPILNKDIAHEVQFSFIIGMRSHLYHVLNRYMESQENLFLDFMCFAGVSVG